MQRDYENDTMHCPVCGAEADLTQKFCRTCGFNLEKVPLLVAEQRSESEAIVNIEVEELQKRQRTIDHTLAVAGLGLGALVALSFLTGLIYLLVVGSMPIVPGVILLVLLIGGITAGSLGIYSERLKKKLSTRVSQKPSEPALRSYEGPLISVTERTTNLLEGSERINTTTKRRKEGEV